MGKNKQSHWTELGTFRNVIQPEIGSVAGNDHPIKGKWRSLIFLNDNPVILELGCGKGEYTVGLAQKYPQNNFIGIDIKGARMWRGAKTSNENGLGNTAFLRTRIEFINSFFVEDEVNEIWITFPDPHPRKRNSNNRLTCPWFLNKYRSILRNNGIVHLKTDNLDLFDYTKRLAERNNIDIITSTNDLYADMPGNEILSIRTHYEAQFLKEGLKINYLAFRLDRTKKIEDGTQKREG